MILVVSRDYDTARFRKHALEAAGYGVICATEFPEIQRACREEKIQLVIMEPGMPPREKKRVWLEVVNTCKVPVLELYEDEPSLAKLPGLFAHRSLPGDDSVEPVNQIMSLSSNDSTLSTWRSKPKKL